ncbi:hypothetical protein PoB_000387200 [Plakobranchus ocellatus]|uniref:Uncharacterized protein n=1 Tax=Plakobranchus ocellatus TaxID=259542 RepID=A0AAV3Y4J5_9GAST|nr:hypothetical protein PoB_000387200 [Plakobranchus ocellatus]
MASIGGNPRKAAQQKAAPGMPCKSEASAPPVAPTKPEQITVPAGGTKPPGFQAKAAPPMATLAPMLKAESSFLVMCQC